MMQLYLLGYILIISTYIVVMIRWLKNGEEKPDEDYKLGVISGIGTFLITGVFYLFYALDRYLRELSGDGSDAFMGMFIVFIPATAICILVEVIWAFWHFFRSNPKKKVRGYKIPLLIQAGVVVYMAYIYFG